MKRHIVAWWGLETDVLLSRGPFLLEQLQEDHATKDDEVAIMTILSIHTW